MLQYDFTDTSLFEKPSRATLPSEAEMFVVTAALLLINEATYSELEHGEVALSDSNLQAVAECIEIRLPEFVRDLERHSTLRKRLAQFGGMRVAGARTPGITPSPKPT